MAPDDIINENDGEQEEEQEQEPNIIDLNNYGMKPYSWRYEGSGGGGGEGGGGGVLVVGATMSEDALTLNKTAGEIIEASKAGLVLLPNNFSGDSVVIFYLSTVDDHEDGSQYDIWFANLADDKVNIEYTCFIATTKNDYPTAVITGN